MPPHLILMPGLHGTGGLFAPLLDQIPREYPTRLIEYPRDRAQSYPQLLLQIERDLQDLEQVILIAESFSGPLALQFAARHPSRVRAVILCVTFVTAPVPRILCWLGAPFALIRFPLPGFLIRMFLAGTAASKEVVRHARREIEASKSHVIAHRVISAGSVDARPALRNCGMPILCLSGSRDRLIGRRSHRTILKIRPGVTLKTLEGPHLLLQTNPAEAWREMEKFLSQLPTSGANGCHALGAGAPWAC